LFAFNLNIDGMDHCAYRSEMSETDSEKMRAHSSRQGSKLMTSSSKLSRQLTSFEDSKQSAKKLRSVLQRKTSKKKYMDSADKVLLHRKVTAHQPWSKAEEEQHWHPYRRKVTKWLHSQGCDAIMGVVILFNLCIIIWEADYEAQCYPQYTNHPDDCPFQSKKIFWVRFTNLSLLVTYSTEALVRLFCIRKYFCFSTWNQLDVFVIVIGWIGEAFGGMVNLAFLRLVRLSRLTRAFRVLLRIRELYLLLNGVVSSMRAIFFGMILLGIMVVGYSIVLVEWVHPVNSTIDYFQCVECTNAYRSVYYSSMTLFKQLIAGDVWLISFPLMDRLPWTAAFFIVLVGTVMLGIVNLILTVIVERAAEARDKDVHDLLEQKAQMQHQMKMDLLRLCSQLDRGGNGRMTLEDLEWAFNASNEFRIIMMKLDVHNEEDLEAIFKMLDVDCSGDLQYEEFCEELIQLESQDLRMMIAMAKYSIQQVHNMLDKMSVDTRIADVLSCVSLQQDQIKTLHAKMDRVLSVLRPQPAESIFFEPACSEPISNSTHVSSPAALAVGSTAEQIWRLHHDIQMIASMEADLVRDAEEQVSTLICHGEKVASLGEIISQVGAADYWCPLSNIPDKLLSAIHPPVATLQLNITAQLSQDMNSIQKLVSGVACALEENGKLIDQIKKLLPCCVPGIRTDGTHARMPSRGSDPISSM